MVKRLKLSVMDIECPSRLDRLVPALDRLGFQRFWTTEHHSSAQSSTPAIVIAHAANLSKRLRIGSAGVMINAHSPARITQEFRVLEALFPGRIDLGVVSARPPADIARALRETDNASEMSFDDRVRELMALISYDDTSKNPVSGKQLGPVRTSSPDFWVCGISTRRARLAGQLGAGFAFHHSMNQHADDPEHGPDVVRAYVDAFQPSPQREAPEIVIGCFGTVAWREVDAREQWRTFFGGHLADKVTPAFLGSARQCEEQLSELAAQYDSGELVINNYTPRLDEKIDGYAALSETMLGALQAEFA